MLPRKNPRIRTLAAAALALALLTASTSVATATPATIDGVRSKIDEIRKRLAEHEGKAASIRADLKGLDKQISLLSGIVRGGERDISKLESGIRSTSAQISDLQARYLQATQASNNRARHIYKAGPAESIAEIFSVKSSSQFARLQVFWQKSSQLDTKTIIEATRLRNQVSERQDDLKRIKSSLTDKEKAVSGQLDLIQQTRADRNTALLAVNKQISTEKDNIKSLEEASRKLTPVLKSSLSHSDTPLGAASISGFLWPIRGAVNSPFGPRWGGFHPGIDIQGSTGTPIHATKAGVVTGIGCGSGYGNCTVIDHGGGVSSLYAHQSSIAISSGPVSAGQVIGYVGCTGSCTGPHLHFEIRINGEPRNPLGFLS